MKAILLALTLSTFVLSIAQSNKDFKKLNKTIEKSEQSVAKKAIWDFVEKFQLETTLDKLTDGKYVGTTPKDNDGYFHRLKVEIKDGRVIKANYDEIKIVKKVEVGKKTDSLYCHEMEETTGISPAEVFLKYEKQLIIRQDISRIDVLRGYEHTLYRFQLAFFDILINKTTEQ